MASEEAAETDSQTFRIPETSYEAVEYPGYVRNVHRALRTLGGLPSIAAGLSNASSFLKLSFRPDDPNAHPIFGESRESRSLVLRVSRKKGDDPEAKPNVQLVASLTTSFHFDGMADFQFLSVDAGARHARDFYRCPSENEPKVAEPSQVVEPLMTLPPMFSKVDMPFDYAFKQFHALPSTAKKQIPIDTAYEGLEQISFLKPDVPQPLPDADMQWSEKEAVIAQHAHAFFEQRPVWVIQMLLERILVELKAGLEGAWDLGQVETRVLLEGVLKKLCYAFKSGPWLHAHILRGFDPRKDPSSCPFQTLLYRLPDDWFERQERQAIERHQPVRASAQAPIAAAQRSAAAPAQRTAAMTKDAAAGCSAAATDPRRAAATAAATTTAAAAAGAAVAHAENARAVAAGNGAASVGTAGAAAGGTAEPPPPPMMDAINRFVALPPGRFTVLQLCDLDDPAVRGALGNVAQSQQQCREISGWLPPAELDNLSSRITSRFEALIRSMPSPASELADKKKGKRRGKRGHTAKQGAEDATKALSMENLTTGTTRAGNAAQGTTAAAADAAASGVSKLSLQAGEATQGQEPGASSSQLEPAGPDGGHPPAPSAGGSGTGASADGAGAEGAATDGAAPTDAMETDSDSDSSSNEGDAMMADAEGVAPPADDEEEEGEEEEEEAGGDPGAEAIADVNMCWLLAATAGAEGADPTPDYLTSMIDHVRQAQPPQAGAPAGYLEDDDEEYQILE